MRNTTQLLSLALYFSCSMAIAGADPTGVPAPVAAAIDVPDPKNPNILPSQLIDLPAVGKGSFKYLFWHIYDAQLQTVDGTFVDYQQSAPLVLSLTYQRDISKSDFIDATLEQWQHQHGEIKQRHQQWSLLLAEIWRDVKTGDTLSCQRLKQGEVQFFLNTVYLGSINEVAFADEFLDIWLSTSTSAPKLRKQLVQAASLSTK